MSLWSLQEAKKYTDKEVKTVMDSIDAHLADDVSQGELHGFRLNQDEKLEYFNGTEYVEVNGGDGSIVDLGTFNDETELITHVVMNQLPTGHYTFIMYGFPYFMLLGDMGSYYKGVLQDSEGMHMFFQVMKTGQIIALNELDILGEIMDLQNLKADKTYVDSQDALKADKTYVDSQDLKQMPISGGVLENYREKLVTLSGTSTAINLSLGNVFTHSLTGNTTYSITNAVSGQAHSFTLIINQTATVRTLTFPSSVKWQGGEIPDLSTASKTYVLTFMTVDGGTTWLGMFGGEF